MDYVKQWVANEKVRSVDLNGIQEQAASLFQIAWSWRGRRPTLACDGSNITIGAHDGVIAGAAQDDTEFVPEAPETTVALSGLSGAAAWYAVYARKNGSSCEYSVQGYVGSPPAASLAYRNTSDKVNVYVGTIRGTGASSALGFHMVNGVYVYEPDFAALVAGTGLTATSFTDVNLADYVPPHARLVDLLAVVSAPDGADPTRVRPNGSTVTGYPLLNTTNTLVLATDSTQKIEYDVGASGSLALYVTGFREK